MTPGMPLVTLAAGDHGLVSDTVGLFTALLGFAATVGILTKFVRIPYKYRNSLNKEVGDFI